MSSRYTKRNRSLITSALRRTAPQSSDPTTTASTTATTAAPSTETETTATTARSPAQQSDLSDLIRMVRKISNNVEEIKSSMNNMIVEQNNLRAKIDNIELSINLNLDPEFSKVSV